MQFYSNPSSESEKWSIPDCQAFQMTALFAECETLFSKSEEKEVSRESF